MGPSAQRAKEVFVGALKLSPDQWPGYLNDVCGDDAALRGRVHDLLHAHNDAGNFLDPEAEGLATIVEPGVDRPGAVIGPYKLLQQIGEGGMGTVFMAEQEQPVRRRVALKIIKRGMDSGQVVARFEAERRQSTRTASPCGIQRQGNLEPESSCCTGPP